jgi:hypothetical protein
MARIHIFKRGAAALARLLPASWRFRVFGVPDAEPPGAAGYGSELYAKIGQARQLTYDLLLQCPPQDPARVHASAILVDALLLRTILESLQSAGKKQE